MTFTASRRPISSSLLAYAGARDPATNGGKNWGGVVATGGGIGLSYDRGGAHGMWADLSAHQISGENVADNSRERLMAGYYYKLINSDNQRATIGLNSMLWHYQKDLSDYTFGRAAITARSATSAGGAADGVSARKTGRMNSAARCRGHSQPPTLRRATR